MSFDSHNPRISASISYSFIYFSYTKNLSYNTIKILSFSLWPLLMASKLAFTLTSPRRPFSTIIQRSFAPLSSSSSSCTRVQSFNFNGRQFCLRRRLSVVPTKATADQEGLIIWCLNLGSCEFSVLFFGSYYWLIWMLFACIYLLGRGFVDIH